MAGRWWSAWIASAAVACSSGSIGSTGSSDAASDTAANSDVGEGCIFGCDPPAPTCADPCNSFAFVPAGCGEGGACEFTTTKTACPFGCDEKSGACSASTCAQQTCGTKVSCGGTCDDPTVCCAENDYDRTTGLAPSGTMVCCDSGDTLIGATDCGVGNNHGYNVAGACATSWEGAGNNGTPCATIHCKKLVCP